jgi:hypothetical protein
LPDCDEHFKSSGTNFKLDQFSKLGNRISSYGAGAWEITISQPLVTGHPPPPRWGACSAMIWTSDVCCRMLLTGGIGPREVTSEVVHSLQCSNSMNMHWDTVTTVGTSPGHRFGHSMISASATTVLIYGGSVLNPSTFEFSNPAADDIFALECVSSTGASLTLRWSSFRVRHSVQRMRHSAVFWSDSSESDQSVKNERRGLTYGCFFVFGGVRSSDGVHGDICIPEHGIKTLDLRKKLSDLSFDNVELPQELTFNSPIVKLIRTGYGANTSFKQLLNTGNFSDLRIQTIGEQIDSDSCKIIKAHSVFLGTISDTFSSLVRWTRDFDDRSSEPNNEPKIIVRPNMKSLVLDSDVFGDPVLIEALLEYIYAGINSLMI